MADTAGGASSVLGLRPEIARSWQRAELAGLHPASEGRPTIADVDVSSRLVVAAGPVLRELAENIDGNTFSLLLTDRACRIVHRWGGDRWFRNMLDDSGIRIGVGLDETAFGTNATGTAMEIGTPVVVHGAEHYLHQFKVFSCYGHPVRHPLTHRIEGVLDITSVGPVSNPLFGPLVQRAARDIESRILDGAREVERRLFLAFQRATRHRYVPVAVLGGDVVLANRACLDLLGAADPSVLRAVLPEVTTRGSTARELDLGRLGRIPVRAERIDGTLDGAVFRLGDRLPPDPVTSGGTPSTNSGCEREWAAQLVGLAARHSGVVVIDDVHVLSEALCTVLRRVMAPARARVVLTSCPVDELPTHVARVAARCVRRIELPPLRERLHELPELLATMGAAVRPDRQWTCSPRALAALGTQPWAGNFAELSGLVDELASRPLAGPIDVGDLPERYRGSSRARGLGGRERAERVAIICALRSAGGNKLRAAEELGISRTTLYRRMQALDAVDAAR